MEERANVIFNGLGKCLVDGADNGRKANEDVCRSSINYFWGLYFIAVNGRKGKRDF